MERLDGVEEVLQEPLTRPHGASAARSIAESRERMRLQVRRVEQVEQRVPYQVFQVCRRGTRRFGAHPCAE
jgi:hypothetical protein